MPLDRAGADEQLGADLRVRSARERQSRDVLLLRGELVAGVVRALPDRLAGREQLVACAVGEPVRADRAEDIVRDTQLRARVQAASFPAQPLAVEQLPSHKLGPQARAAEVRVRVAVGAL